MLGTNSRWVFAPTRPYPFVPKESTVAIFGSVAGRLNAPSLLILFEAYLIRGDSTRESAVLEMLARLERQPAA
jgi:hypothetical protein